MRLRRVGTKGRPFYRVVVAPSTSGRDGRFVEILGTYDPVSKPVAIKINEARALHWLLQGAQPSETTAIVLSRSGVLEKFFEQRPSARKDFKFLDKTTSLSSKTSVVTTTPSAAPAPKAAPAPQPVVEAVAAVEPEVEAPSAAEAPATTTEPEIEAPAAPEAPEVTPEPEIEAPAEPEPAAEPVTAEAAASEESA